MSVGDYGHVTVFFLTLVHDNSITTHHAVHQVPSVYVTFSCTVLTTTLINLLKPAGHVMHQQFNIQQLYALPTLYLCVLYLSENRQRLVPLTA